MFDAVTGGSGACAGEAGVFAAAPEFVDGTAIRRGSALLAAVASAPQMRLQSAIHVRDRADIVRFQAPAFRQRFGS